MTAEEYRNYLETDFDDVDLKELKDIRKIRIDRNHTKEKRIAQYLNSEQRATFVTRGINNTVVKLLNDPDYYHILDNKTEFYTMFNDYLHRKWLNFAKCSKSEFVDFMQEFDEIICKPDDLCCGKGVDKLKKADFGSLDDMYDELKRRHISIVEEVVKQHHDMSRINPDSVNTIRVYTVLTDGKANAIYACIRMGNSDRPVDNINAGGMYSPIDMKTGKIAFPACDKQRKVYEKHPRSGWCSEKKNHTFI